MKLGLKRVALLVFLLWEGYWAYVFFNATVPDERMDTVFALLMAVFLPIFVGALWATFFAVRRAYRRSERSD